MKHTLRKITRVAVALALCVVLALPLALPASASILGLSGDVLPDIPVVAGCDQYTIWKYTNGTYGLKVHKGLSAKYFVNPRGGTDSYQFESAVEWHEYKLNPGDTAWSGNGWGSTSVLVSMSVPFQFVASSIPIYDKNGNLVFAPTVPEPLTAPDNLSFLSPFPGEDKVPVLPQILILYSEYGGDYICYRHNKTSLSYRDDIPGLMYSETAMETAYEYIWDYDTSAWRTWTPGGIAPSYYFDLFGKTVVYSSVDIFHYQDPGFIGPPSLYAPSGWNGDFDPEILPPHETFPPGAIPTPEPTPTPTPTEEPIIIPGLNDGSNNLSGDVGNMSDFMGDMQTQMNGALGGLETYWNLDVTKFIPAVAFVTGLFGDIFAQLGDFSVIIIIPLVVGLAMMFIGRGTRESNRIARTKKMSAKRSAAKGKKG